MFTITIGEDLDGFLGYDSVDIDKIEIEQSQRKYESMVEEWVKESHPEISQIIFDWGGKMDLSEIEYLRDRMWLQEDLEYIEGMVYNSQNFWVFKKK